MYADSPRSATSTPLAAAESDSIGCPVTPSFSFVFAFGHTWGQEIFHFSEGTPRMTSLRFA